MHDKLRLNKFCQTTIKRVKTNRAMCSLLPSRNKDVWLDDNSVWPLLIYLFFFLLWLKGEVGFGRSFLLQCCFYVLHIFSLFIELLDWLTLFFRMQKLPSIEQRQQKSDIPHKEKTLRQHSYAWMVSFPRKSGNKNAHSVHPSEQMRVLWYGMVKGRSSRGKWGHCNSKGLFQLS